MSEKRLKRGAWVQAIHGGGMDGLVTRVAKDGSWADVKWSGGWSKRMQCSYLREVDTIQRGDLTITVSDA